MALSYICWARSSHCPVSSSSELPAKNHTPVIAISMCNITRAHLRVAVTRALVGVTRRACAARGHSQHAVLMSPRPHMTGVCKCKSAVFTCLG